MKRMGTMGLLCVCCLLVLCSCGPTKFTGDWESENPYMRIHFAEGANGFTGEMEWNGEVITFLIAQDFGNGLDFYRDTLTEHGYLTEDNHLFFSRGKVKGNTLYLYDAAEETVLYELDRVVTQDAT